MRVLTAPKSAEGLSHVAQSIVHHLDVVLQFLAIDRRIGQGGDIERRDGGGLVPTVRVLSMIPTAGPAPAGS